jgi:hypothetical protein
MLKCVAIFVALSTSFAYATDRWFGDIEAKSRNGRYVAAAKSPDNRSKDPKPFQSNFKYTLQDKSAGKKLWEFTDRDEPAGELFVSDTGKVVALSGYNGLTYIRTSGERIKFGRVVDLIPKKEVERYCDETSVGVFWSQFSWRGFLNVKGNEYFYIRTYWGRIFVIDLEGGTLSESGVAKQAVESAVHAKAKEILAIPRKAYWQPCPECGGRHINENLSKGIFVLVQHNEKGIAGILKFIKESDDNHMFHPRDYLSRMRGRQMR